MTVASLPLVSIVLAVRNEAPYLSVCLEALALQSYPTELLEVIVADGCSTDGTAALARGFDGGTPRMRVIENPRRVAPAGFNLGIRASHGEVIIILGARAEVAPDFVAESVAALARTGADAVGGVVESRAWAGSNGATARAVALALRSPFGVGDARYRYGTREQEVDTVNYGAYRRDVFDRIGLFDEDLAFVEDDEFNYRLRAAGGRLVLSPAIQVRYYARPSLRALWLQQYRWGLNKPKVARRHPAQMRPRHAVPALFVLTVALSAAALPISRTARRILAATVSAYALANSAAILVATRKAEIEPPRRHARQDEPTEDEGGPSARNPPSSWRPWRLGDSTSSAPRPDVAALGRLPAAFAAMHVAYGSGMLIGLARTLMDWTNSGKPAPAPPTLGQGAEPES